MYDAVGLVLSVFFFFFFQAEDGIRDPLVTGVQTCALPICGVPPLTGTTRICSSRSQSATPPVLRNAICFPSGEKLGLRSEPGHVTSIRTSPLRETSAMSEF